MTLQIKAVNQVAQTVARQINEGFRHLHIHFITYHEGQRAEAFGLAGSQLMNHPAAETALHLLTKARQDEESALIGIAVARQHILMGLASRNTVLVLCGLNIDQYETLTEARRHAYHMAWHAIDALEYHSDIASKGKASREIIIRRRNALELISANLRADVFAVIMASLHGDGAAITHIGQTRGLNTLQNIPSHNPEHFPFVIAMESAAIALQQVRRKGVPKKRYVETALKIASEVGKAFDESALKQWLAFSEPAQDMAWRGYSREQILSAAINTSNDTYVRATGYLVSEVTGVQPASILEISDTYSPFADDLFNKNLHEKAVDDVFEDVIAQGLRSRTADPFLEMAYRQNMDMADGKVIGWCAHALQASARAFDAALKSGREPEMAARKEFEGERNQTTWESLKSISKKIIGKYREGYAVTLSDIVDMCKDEGSGSSLQKSLEFTMATPAYQRGLTAAPAARGPAPSGPAAAPRMGPAAPAGPQAPTLGGGAAGRAQAIQQARRQAAQKQAQHQKATKDGNRTNHSGTTDEQGR